MRLRRARWFAAAMLTMTALAACGDEEPDAGAIEVVGTDGLAFEPADVTVSAGEVTIELTSEPAAPHTFTIEERSGVEVVEAAGGETATGTVELEPGTYTFYCSVPGHREAGMEGRLNVE